MSNGRIGIESILQHEQAKSPFFSRQILNLSRMILTHFCFEYLGPAAVRAVTDVNTTSAWMSLLVHYPQNQISEFQRRQMTTSTSKQVRVATFQGGGDDMDLPIKRIMTSGPADPGRKICGVNSYNIGRPLTQMVHYVRIN